MALSNNQIKYISSLQQKKFREETGHFIVEGEKIVSELILQHKYKIVGLYAREKWIETHKKLLSSSNINFHICSEKDMERISLLKTATQVITVLENKETKIPNPKNKQNLVLENIQDPGNLGTIIRTADWFGIENIFCSENTVEITNPKVIQATMGSFLRVNVSYIDLESLILAHPNIPCYAALLEGKNAFEINFPNEMFLMIGNEGKGLSEKILSVPNFPVSIPKFGKAESLNAAIATAILCAKIRM
jgi:TrmH family RNA methyltransferase